MDRKWPAIMERFIHESNDLSLVEGTWPVCFTVPAFMTEAPAQIFCRSVETGNNRSYSLYPGRRTMNRPNYRPL